MAQLRELDDTALEALFQLWDTNHDGMLTLEEVRNGLRVLRLPTSEEDITHYTEQFRRMDANRDGKVSRGEVALSFPAFRQLVRNRDEGLRNAFEAIDRDHNGSIDRTELTAALRGVGMAYDSRAVDKLFKRLDADGNGLISFEEFREVLIHVPDASLEAVLDYWERAAVLNIDGDGMTLPTRPQHASDTKHAALINSFAGGISAVLSKTSTAPIERLKVLFQQYTTTPPSMVGTLKRIYAAEGVRGLFRGNLVNLMKSSPESSVKFAVFEQTKTWLDPTDERSLTALELFGAGAMGGVAAHTAGFPLEVLKTKMAGAEHGVYTSVIDCIRKTYRSGGVGAFYRGLAPTIASTIPHAGVSLSTYQMSKDIFTTMAGAEQPTAAALVGAATVSTVCGLTVSAPMHVIKTRLIMGDGSSSTLGLIRNTWRQEGPAGFFRGFAPSLIKGIPSHIVSFGAYEFFRRAFGLQEKHHKKH